LIYLYRERIIHIFAIGVRSFSEYRIDGIALYYRRRA